MSLRRGGGAAVKCEKAAKAALMRLGKLTSLDADLLFGTMHLGSTLVPVSQPRSTHLNIRDLTVTVRREKDYQSPNKTKSFPQDISFYALGSRYCRSVRHHPNN